MILKKLSRFTEAERDRFEDADGQIFALSMYQTLRYYQFLRIIRERYEEANRNYLYNARQIAYIASRNNFSKVTEEQNALIRNGRHLNTLLHLEIEGFYLFSEVLLNHIAVFLQEFFGGIEGVSLESHKALAENLDNFRKSKAIIIPTGFSSNVRYLNHHIVEIREKQKYDFQQRREVRDFALNFRGDAESGLPFYQLYTQGRDPFDWAAVSESISNVNRAIDTYLLQLKEVLANNRAKTKFRLKES